MPFNTHWGNEAKPFKDSLYTQNNEKVGTPLPPPTLKYVVDIHGNFVATINAEKVIAGS